MKLYPYQIHGARFLADRRRAYLADVPGLGKTAQAIRASKLIAPRNVLVVAPAVALPVWHQEWQRWWPRGADRIRVVSYTKLAMDLADKREPPVYDTVILDEAHYTKSPHAHRTAAALRVAAAAKRSAWLLSGSPMPNDPTELWTAFRFLWPDRIPRGISTYEGWRDHFTSWHRQPVGRFGNRTIAKVTGVRNGAELRDMLRGIMLRRHVKDVGLQLPPLRLHVVPLPADERLAEELEAFQIVETPVVRRLLGAAKVAPITDTLIDEALPAVVVMYHHKDTGKYLRYKLSKGGYEIFGFDGSTPTDKRAEQVEAFQAGTKRAAFVVQQQAGGVAITLTRANEIVLVEPDWSPEVNAQAIKRVYRIGQDQPVRARMFSVTGSLDEGIMAGLARKIGMQKEVLP